MRFRNELALDLAGLALIAWGVAMIYAPAGVIIAGLACLALGWRFERGAEGLPPR